MPVGMYIAISSLLRISSGLEQATQTQPRNHMKKGLDFHLGLLYFNTVSSLNLLDAGA